MSPSRVPENGSRGCIVPIGGRIGDSNILAHFYQLCGGARANLAIIPTASSDPDIGAYYEQTFKALGARTAIALPIEGRADCERQEVLDALEKADGVFLTGGTQLRLSTTLGGTSVAKVLRRRNASGQHVAGTSAGAAFLSEHMIAFGDEGPTPRQGMVALAPGLGLTNRVVVDQHFRQRDRLGRLLMALALNPFAVGIGLDEDTAAFIGADDIIEIRGSGAITLVDPSHVEYSAADHAPQGEPVTLIGCTFLPTAPPTTCIPAKRARPRKLPNARRRTPSTFVMRILDRRVFVGPSLYAHFPVIRLEVDLGPLEDWPTKRLGESFIGALLDRLPGLHDHGCSYGTPGGFIRRMREDEGTWLGHVLEHSAIELQNTAGESVTFGKTRSVDGRPGVYDVVFEYEQAEVGTEAATLALALLHSLLPATLRPDDFPADFDWEHAREEFIRYAQRRALGPSTASIVHEAARRGIPWTRMNQFSLIQLGYGRYQRRIQATVTSMTPHIAVELASDKEETNKILASLGLPVPQQRLTQSEAGAVAAAERIGYPVVVKPYNANHGRGVSILLQNPEQVRHAFGVAKEHSRSVLVESFITGFDHRLLVINGELVAASRREPGHVVGDGTHTVEELVAIVNSDPRRGIGHEKVLTRIELDEQAEQLMQKRGLTRTSVPLAGDVVYLRLTANLSTGGTASDVTDSIHPDNVEMAVRAIKAIGLDVGGVDFLTPDITKSYKDIGGAICEINAAPGFRMHTAPSEGKPRDAAARVIDMLFPPGSPSLIPIAAITGTNGKTTTSRMLAHIHKLAGHTVGMTSTDGLYIDGQRTVAGDMTGPVSTRMALADPTIDVAVLEIARGGLLRAGMAVRHVDVGAVLNVQSDHLGMRGIETLEQLAEVKRVVAEIARDTVVLNADDPLCLRMASYTEAKNVCYVTMNPQHQLVREHIRAGGRAIGLEAGVNGQMITLYDKGAHIPLLWTHLIPATLEGKASFNVQNAMVAAAMAFSMGVRLEDIRNGLRTFHATFYQAPGRLNVYDEHPFKVIMDYGHNAAAVDQLCQLAKRLDVKHRRICVVAGPGDRRDDDLREIGAAAARGGFDHYICRRDDDLRGRDGNAVPEIIRDALRAGGIDDSRISVIPDEQLAIDAALRMAQPGDLLLLFADAIARSWKQVVHFKPDPSDPAGAPVAISPNTAPVEEAPVGFIAPVMSDDVVIVRDERGVRLAREVDD